MTRPRPTADAAREPLSVTHDPGKRDILGWLCCLAIAAGFAVFFATRVVAEQGSPPRGGDPSEAIMLFAGFSLGSLVLVALTLRAVRGRRKRMRIFRHEAPDILCFDGHGLLWREAAAAYRAVLWHEETRSHLTKYGRTHYTVQVVSLDHPDAGRRFEIFAHAEADKLPERCALWSERLGLPVVRAEAGQAVRRSAEELTKPLLELAAEGRLQAAFDDLGPAPGGVTWGRDGEEVWARARPSLFFAIFFAPLLLLGGVVSVFEAGRFLSDQMALLIICLSAALVLFAGTLTLRQMARITAGAVVTETRCLGLVLWSRRLDPAAITRVRRLDWVFCDALRLEGRDGNATLGLLGRKAALWLVPFLQGALIGQAAQRESPAAKR